MLVFFSFFPFYFIFGNCQSVVVGGGGIVVVAGWWRWFGFIYLFINFKKLGHVCFACLAF